MVRLMAPIFSFTAEEIWEIMPKLAGSSGSVFVSEMPAKPQFDSQILERFSKFMSLRQDVMKALEKARAEKFIGNSLAASVTIECDADARSFLESFGGDLADLFLVSGAKFGKAEGAYLVQSEDNKGFAVSVSKADGEKCERCWKYSESVGKNTEHPTICARCAGVLSS